MKKKMKEFRIKSKRNRKMNSLFLNKMGNDIICERKLKEEFMKFSIKFYGIKIEIIGSYIKRSSV